MTFQVSIEVFQLELQGEVKARTIDVPVTYETWGQITNDHGDLGDLRLFGCLDLSAPPFSDQVQGPVFIQSIRQNWIGTEAENGKDALFAMNRVIVLSDYIAGGEDGLGKCSFPSEDEKVCFVNLGETSPADDPVNIDCSGEVNPLVYMRCDDDANGRCCTSGVRDKLGVALPEGAKEGAYPANAIAFSGPSWDEVAEYSDNRR